MKYSRLFQFENAKEVHNYHHETTLCVIFVIQFTFLNTNNSCMKNVLYFFSNIKLSYANFELPCWNNRNTTEP